MNKKDQTLSSDDVIQRLQTLTPFLMRYALGDFSEMIPVPEQEDEFTELLVAINLMVEDFQELLREQDETIAKLLETERQLDQEKHLLSDLVDAIDEVIYVSDPETYELLHINQTFKDVWGEDTLGKICYQVLQGQEAPCPFCTNHKIFGENQGKSHVWEYQNQVNGEWYRCTDKAIPWTGGKQVRFQIAARISKQKADEEILQENLARLEKFNRLAVDRETKMIDLKREVNQLSSALGREEPYDLSFSEQAESAKNESPGGGSD